MDLLRRGRGTDNDRRSLLTDADLYGGLHMLAAYGSADSGVAVNPDTAMTAAGVYACVSRITRDLSTLPVHVVDRESGSRVHDHHVARLLRSPNEYQTPATFWTAYAMNLLLYGNGYASVEFDADHPVAMLPLMASCTLPRRIDGQLVYQTHVLKQDRPLPPDLVLHTPYMAVGGILGASPIAFARQTIGTSLALDKFVARFFANGTNLGSIIELPAMSREALQQTQQHLREQYTGVDNAHKMLAIPGAKAHKLGFSPRDSQSVEAQEWELRQIARVFNMPIGIIAAETSHYAGIEAQYRDYAQATLRPFAVLIEQEFGRKLFREDEQDRYVIRFNLDAVVRASLADRTEADTKLVQAGIITPNEARAHHDLPPIEGGDRLLSPLNMVPADARSAPRKPRSGEKTEKT